jgi:hypothetical protein
LWHKTISEESQKETCAFALKPVKEMSQNQPE